MRSLPRIVLLHEVLLISLLRISLSLSRVVLVIVILKVFIKSREAFILSGIIVEQAEFLTLLMFFCYSFPKTSPVKCFSE